MQDIMGNGQSFVCRGHKCVVAWSTGGSMGRLKYSVDNNTASRIRRWVDIAAAAIVVLQIGLLVHTCCYTFFTADDYWHAMEAGGAMTSANEVWKAAWSFMRMRYAGWQGTYLTMFLQIAFCPLCYGTNGAYAALHILLAAVCIAFFLTMYLLVRELAKWSGLSSERGILEIYALVVTCLLNLRSYAEDFFWFSGTVSYTIPLVLAMAGVALLVHTLQERRRCGVAGLVGASVLLFLACGGSLEIALPVCYGMLILCVYLLRGWKRERKGGWKLLYLGPIAAAYVGTVVNGLAPGNYVRHDVTAQSGSALGTMYHAVCNTLFQYFDETGRVADASVLCVFCVLAIMTGAFLTAKKAAWGGNYGRLKELALVLLPLPVIAIFPVILGYGSVGLPERTYLMLDLSYTAVGISAGVLLGGYLAKAWGERGGLLGVLALMAIVVMMTDSVCLYRVYEGDPRTQAPMSVLAMDLQKGWTQQYYRDVLDFYDRIESADGTQVQVDAEELSDAPEGLMPLIVLKADAVAEYYGKSE